MKLKNYKTTEMSNPERYIENYTKNRKIAEKSFRYLNLQFALV